MSCLRSVSRYVGLKVRDYFHNSSIQGLRYITEPNRDIYERIFWSLICTLSAFGTYILFKGAWYNYNNNAVSFVVETSYLQWNTTFAAISLCEGDDPEKISNSGAKVYGRNRDMSIDFYIRDVVFFKGACYSCSKYCGKTLNCSDDFDFIVKKVRSPCEEFLKYCTWNGKPFNCCSEFLPLHTEYGTCYTINSVHTKKNGTKMELISNRFTGPGRLELKVFDFAWLYMHGPEDVPYINHPVDERQILNIYTHLNMRYMVAEIRNDPLLKEVSLEQRNCRFPTENNLKYYEFYSYSACVTECRANAQIDFCNCTTHFMPKLDGVNTCGIKGLSCLSDNAEYLLKLKTIDNPEKGIVCDCMSSCNEPEFTILGNYLEENDEDVDEELDKDPTRVEVLLDALPNQRFKRNVVRTRLDLVVSMGGTAGLFLGASVLSIAEFLVFMLLRKSTPERSKKDESPPRSQKGGRRGLPIQPPAKKKNLNSTVAMVTHPYNQNYQSVYRPNRFHVDRYAALQTLYY